MPQSEPTFDDLLNGCTRFAYHLEMRDVYSVSDEIDEFEQWRTTGQVGTAEYWQPWTDQVKAMRTRGVIMRRLRIVSLPPSEYIRYEHACTINNIAAGEDVRWLPRRHAADLALPGADCWVFDGTAVRWGHFDGNGEHLSDEFTFDPQIGEFCTEAFERAWSRATPHAEFDL